MTDEESYDAFLLAAAVASRGSHRRIPWLPSDRQVAVLAKGAIYGAVRSVGHSGRFDQAGQAGQVGDHQVHRQMADGSSRPSSRPVQEGEPKTPPPHLTFESD